MLRFVWSNSYRFPVLFREFCAQFFASESATSDHHVRQAIIGVLAFLITPGFLFPLQLSGAFEFAAIRFPAMLDPLIRLVTTIFITYGIVSIGVIAAFTWDSLGFDRRDAMVLGPTPVGGATIVTAKLAALAALLLAGAAMVNVTAGFSFALLASNHAGVTSVVRYFIAHGRHHVGRDLRVLSARRDSSARGTALPRPRRHCVGASVHTHQRLALHDRSRADRTEGQRRRPPRTSPGDDAGHPGLEPDQLVSRTVRGDSPFERR